MTELKFSPLPQTDVAPGVRKGRVPAEGYQRGLAIGSDLAAIESESLYQHAFRSTRLQMLFTPQKRANLYLILTRFLPRLADRNVVEFGVYRGGSAVFMALVLQEVAPEAKLYALDTFEGMPPVDQAIDAHHQGDFADAALEDLERRIADLRVKNLIIVKGRFEETFGGVGPGEKFGLAHIDADIYSAITYAQTAVWPRMTRGGYVAYDDADYFTCLGASEAVEELIQQRGLHSEQMWPHFVFRAGLETHDDV